MVFQQIIPFRNRRRNVTVRPCDEAYPLSTLHRRMNRMFDDVFGDFSLSPYSTLLGGTEMFVPRMDVNETDTEITLTAELAGMDEKDVEITVQEDVLTIKGEKKSEHEDKEGTHCRSERSYGTFSRSIALPENVDQEKIDAAFKRGI
ncbi:MAG: Hsp20/alpha crystallin family protein, partial [Planctomycetota bacterium]